MLMSVYGPQLTKYVLDMHRVLCPIISEYSFCFLTEIENKYRRPIIGSLRREEDMRLLSRRVGKWLD